MAEAFGVFAGAAGLAALFTPCVECFEYVQFSRKFGKDYESCLVKLDVVRLRLSRWGVSVGLVADSTEPRPSTLVPNPQASGAEKALVEAILGQIIDAFDEVQATSTMFKTKAEKTQSTDLALFDPNTVLASRFRSLHLKTRHTASRRQRGTSVLQKAAWALYKKKKFDRLIDDVSGFVDTLEKDFPGTQGRRRALCIQEVSVIDSTEDLKLLGDVAGRDDPLLTETVAAELANRGTVYRNFEISGEETAKTHVGKRFAPGEGRGGQRDTFDGFKIFGKGFTHVGDDYGIS